MHAWIDGRLRYLLPTPHPDRRMGDDAGISGGRGGMEKLVIVAISFIFLTESLDRKHVIVLFISMNDVDIFIIVRVEEFSLVISLENALYLKNALC